MAFKQKDLSPKVTVIKKRLLPQGMSKTIERIDPPVGVHYYRINYHAWFAETNKRQIIKQEEYDSYQEAISVFDC